MNAGALTFNVNAEGSELSQTLNLCPNDNTWVLRQVAVTIWVLGEGAGSSTPSTPPAP